MSNLAIEAALGQAWTAGQRHVFKRVMSQTEARVGDGAAVDRLSLSSGGYLYPRAGTTDRQQASEATEQRSLRVEVDQLVVNPMWLTGGSVAVSRLAGAVSPDYRVFTSSTRVEPRFLHHLLRSQPYRDQYDLFVRANTTFDRRIQQQDLDQMPLWLPPRGEQRRIADFLDDRVARIDQIIAARSKQVDLVRVAGSRAIADALLGTRSKQLGVPPWFEPLGDEGTVRVAARWSVIDCKHRTPSYLDSGYPVISPGDITPGRLDLSVASRFVGEADFADLADDLRRCRRGDLVYSRNASAGIAAFVDTDEPFTMGQDVCRITSLTENQLYLAYCLNYLSEPQLEAARIGATFTRINIPRIKGLVVPYRAPSGQAHLATLCDEIDDEVRARERALTGSIALLTEYKQSLITAAVTGGLDVTIASSGIPG